MYRLACGADCFAHNQRIFLRIYAVYFANVDASVQYPMVTGGTIIVSTALSFWDVKKPTSREIFSVGLAFVGILSLFLISA